MLVGGVIDDQFGDDFKSEPMGLDEHGPEIIECSELRMNVRVLGNVVAVIFER